MKETVIVTGSKGLLGSEISKFLKNTHKVVELDYLLGHDLEDETFVKEWFLDNHADYLVNCFALNDHVDATVNRSTLFSVTLESVSNYLNVNVLALFSVCREFSKQNRSKGIVNFSSTYGIVSPVPDLYSNGEKHIGYSISKAAVTQLTRHLSVHLAPNIRVNCIVPGGVEHSQENSFIDAYAKKTPMKRMMRKEELNGIIKYLCSNDSSYMTGSIITIDGGWTSV